jgi:hypothetical protein
MQLSHQMDGTKGQPMNVIKGPPIFMKHDLKHKPYFFTASNRWRTSTFQSYENISFKQNYVTGTRLVLILCHVDRQVMLCAALIC